MEYIVCILSASVLNYKYAYAVNIYAVIDCFIQSSVVKHMSHITKPINSSSPSDA